MNNLRCILNTILVILLFWFIWFVSEENQCTQDSVNTAVAQAFEEYLELEGYVVE